MTKTTAEIAGEMFLAPAVENFEITLIGDDISGNTIAFRGTLGEAKAKADDRFGDGFRDHELSIVRSDRGASRVDAGADLVVTMQYTPVARRALTDVEWQDLT